MKIGYACLCVAVEGTKISNCNLKSATPERLLSLVKTNLFALERMIDYNIANGISLYRISSDIVPFALQHCRGSPVGRALSIRFIAHCEQDSKKQYARLHAPRSIYCAQFAG